MGGGAARRLGPPPTLTLPRKGGGDSEAGFTLVELLVALSLLALLSVLLFGGFRFGLRAWEVGDRRMEASDRLAQAQGLLRTLIEQAEPPPGIPGAPPTFKGAPGGLELVAPLPAHRGYGGLYRFTLATVEGDRADRLVLAWRPYDEDARAGAPADRAELLDAVASLQLDFFGAEQPGAPRRWQERWSAADRLPELVRLRIERDAAGLVAWPDLVVAPRLARPGG